MQAYIIEVNQAGQRLDKFLQKCLPQAAAGFLYKMLRKKNITLNGRKADGRELLQPGDQVKLFLADETFVKFGGVSADDKNALSRAVDISEYENAYQTLKGIQVIYEDAHVLILDKPAGLLTQKASDADPSLNEWMIGYLLHTGAITPSELVLFRPSVCNRLDRNTSGLVLCGRSLRGSQALNELIRTRTVRKFYRTVCVGELAGDGILQGTLKKDHRSNTVTVDLAGKGIQTAYHVIGHIPPDYTYLEVELITGKTHQIRAHLAGIGHPLAGDCKYGSPEHNAALKRTYGLKRQLLHAYRIEFPVLTGALETLSGVVITSPLPKDLADLLKHLES